MFLSKMKKAITFRNIMISLVFVCILINCFNSINNRNNSGLPPIEALKKQYPQIDQDNLDYQYIIIDDYLFYCITDSIRGVAFKTNNDGFVFEYSVSAQSHLTEYSVKKVMDVIINITKIGTKYIIEIYTNDMKMYNNDKELVSLKSRSATDTMWVDICDISQEIEIYAMYNDQKKLILDNKAIEKFFR